MATWVAEYGYQPPERPATSAILYRLNKEVDSQGKPVILPCVVGNTSRVGYRAEDDETYSGPAVVAIHPTISPFRRSKIDLGGRSGSPGIADSTMEPRRPEISFTIEGLDRRRTILGESEVLGSPVSQSRSNQRLGAMLLMSITILGIIHLFVRYDKRLVPV